MRQYRHGDLLIVEVADGPPGGRALEERVLAYGEVTGHAHRVDEAGALYEKDGRTYLRASSAARLTHEEHNTITLPEGWYQVIRQREYTPQEVRYVVD